MKFKFPKLTYANMLPVLFGFAVFYVLFSETNPWIATLVFIFSIFEHWRGISAGIRIARKNLLAAAKESIDGNPGAKKAVVLMHGGEPVSREVLVSKLQAMGAPPDVIADIKKKLRDLENGVDPAEIFPEATIETKIVAGEEVQHIRD
jgi:hypothetical protein